MIGIRPKDIKRAIKIRSTLISFRENTVPLTGLVSDEAVDTLVAQIVESIRRQEYFHSISRRDLDGTTFDPNNSSFNPYHLAVSLDRNGQTDEAIWLIFLAIYYGKHEIDGWSLLRKFYGKLGEGRNWTYQSIKSNANSYAIWIRTNIEALSEGRFGNHRKYATVLSANGNGLANSIESFLHKFEDEGPSLFIDTRVRTINDPRVRFEHIYRIFKDVHGFGRLGSFDIATTLCHLNLLDGSPGHPFLMGATGPLAGARLLLTGDKISRLSASDLNPPLLRLMEALDVDGQVIEDALCNWQKSPTVFVPFR